MYVDKSSINCPVIKANYTLTFQNLKLCFLLPENEEYAGEVTVLDIGLHYHYHQTTSSNYRVIDHPLIQSIYTPRKKFSNKGTFGHSLVVAGSKGKIGAAILATKACLRSGAGLVTAVLPDIGLPIMQTALPEAMVITTDEIDNLNLENYAAIGIGPGLGNTPESTDLLVKILNNYNKPIVIDADALNIIAQQKQALSFLPPGSILTPHPKEYERIFGKSKNNFERLKTASKIAKKLHCFIILKGHYTFVACPTGKGYFNSTGNAGMATAGSGDVLTGIITGLLSQGNSSLHASLLGVYIHGLAGDIAADNISKEALIAGDIIESLGKSFVTLH
jgi:NAD(P)H-hydrate epimerase